MVNPTHDGGDPEGRTELLAKVFSSFNFANNKTDLFGGKKCDFLFFFSPK